MTQTPAQPKIYHIVHIDRLPSIIADGSFWSDSVVARRSKPGTTIGMSGIKARRLTLEIQCQPGLHVGDCVPFYFCPRSVMLFLIYQSNHPELNYRGGQGPIVHLEADLHAAVRNCYQWCEAPANN
jgi:ssDNA thymidine ADP-ribosyltransferase, DarT